VLRWSALAVGVFYGFSHQASITAREKSAKIKHEYDQQESLIQKAKAEWAKKNSPAPTSSGTLTQPLPRDS
jgi:F-type H+-transporting ATP synthase subunit e